MINNPQVDDLSDQNSICEINLYPNIKNYFHF